jgi:hypothetical protein
VDTKQYPTKQDQASSIELEPVAVSFSKAASNQNKRRN